MEAAEKDDAPRRSRRHGKTRDRDREQRASRRSKDEDGKPPLPGAKQQRALTGREKGLKESRSWRSESPCEGEQDTPALSPGTARRRSVAHVDTALLERELDALFDRARRWIGDELPGSPAAGRGSRSSSRRLLPAPTAAPERFAAGRQYPLDAALGVALPSELSCPAVLFEQVYSAWLWGLGEATPECQRTLEYREKWVEGKRAIVEKVIKYTAKKNWTRDKCLEDVGKLLQQVEAAQRAYCSSRSLEAANSDWAGQEFQESLTALCLWHEAHAEGSILRWFLDSYSWAHDKQDQRHDRTHVWEGPQPRERQPRDQARGLKWTIDRVVTYTNRRLLHADLEADTDPSVFSRMLSKGLPMLIVHECASPALSPLPLISSYTSEKSLCGTESSKPC